MAYPHSGGQLQNRDAAARRTAPRAVAPAGAAAGSPRARRAAGARRAISCFMAAVLVATMSPVASGLPAFATPSDALGGGASMMFLPLK